MKMGTPHFVDFGRNMEHSPDGKAYLVGHGALDDDPAPRIAGQQLDRRRRRLSGPGDAEPARRSTIGQVTNSSPGAGRTTGARLVAEFRGHPAARLPGTTGWAARRSPTTRPLRKYLMCVTDGWPGVEDMNSYILEADEITGPVPADHVHGQVRPAGLFPDLPVEVHRRRRPDAPGSAIRPTSTRAISATGPWPTRWAAATLGRSRRSGCSTRRGSPPCRTPGPRRRRTGSRARPTSPSGPGSTSRRSTRRTGPSPS